MSRSSEAFDALKFAMIDTSAACLDDDRFIDDDQAPADLTPICASCPLFDLCNTYAAIERPAGGIWAGKRYTQRTTKRTEEN